jgi:hypothetical protein
MKKILDYMFAEQVTITRMEKVMIHGTLLFVMLKGVVS